MVGGHHRVEAQLGEFFSQVVADVEGLKGGRREFHPQALDEAEDVLGGASTGGELGGEEGHLSRDQGDGIEGREAGLAEVAKDLAPGLLLLGVPDILHFVVVRSWAMLSREGFGYDSRHAPIIGTRPNKRSSRKREMR